jgi:hypothetical protein
LSATSQAQEVPTEKPRPIVGGEIRRAPPAAPIVQQSPNGLFALSITDEGIELRGPSGGVRITNAGIEIGAPNGSRVTISAVGMELWGDKALKVNARESVEIVNGPGANIVKLSPAGMELTGQGLVQVKGVGTVEIVNGTAGPGMNVVRLSNTGMVLTGGKSVQMNSKETVELLNGPGANVVKLSPGGMELTGTKVTLGCPGGTGGRRAARLGDAVYAAPTTGTGAISGGTTKVLICD